MEQDKNQNNFIVVAYYTKNTLYAQEVERLLDSMNALQLSYAVTAIKSKGKWIDNVNYKPTFIKNVLLQYPKHSIVYVDCDAEFVSYPKLFDEYTKDPSVEMAMHEFDRGCYGENQKGKLELLSGTIYLRNTTEVFLTIKAWEKECKANPKTWDQKSLKKVVGDGFTRLPKEYCAIFDRTATEDSVIVHYQASRKARKLERNK